MKDEARALKDRISKLSDEKVLMIASVNSAFYRKDTVAYAVEELTMRGIPFSPSGETLEELTSREISTYSDEEPVSYTRAPKYKGIRGWLLLFWLGQTIISPLIFIAYIILAVLTIKHTVVWLLYQDIYTFDIYLLLVIIVYVIIPIINTLLIFCNSAVGIYAGVALWARRYNAVKTTKRCLLIELKCVGTQFLLSLVSWLILRNNELLWLNLLNLVGGTIYFATWSSYFKYSKRVRVSYADDYIG
jgi:hypothetical protein